jgi:hypothetical protein
MVSGQKLSAWVAEIDGEVAAAATSLFNTRADAIASADIPATQLALRTAGYSAVGDGGAGLYKRMSSAPSDPSNTGYFRCADRYTSVGVEDATHGGYWSLSVWSSLAGRGIRPRLISVSVQTTQRR